MKCIRYGSKTLETLLGRRSKRQTRLVDRVASIVQDVRINGDAALVRYTRRFDKVKLLPKEIRVSEEEINACYQNIKPDFIASLKAAIENVTRFYRMRLNHKSWKSFDEDGVMLGERVRPMDSVGIYVPAGTVPLVSSVYMTVVPAQVAGVKNIYMVTPPNAFGSVDPHILAAANLLKVNAVYKAGGAQAIAALAYGTKTIPRVDKIVGPGNAYVAEAKRQVYGDCDIDMIAGPTELVILANETADTRFVLADMEAQAEHAGGTSILVTTSKKLCREMKGIHAPGYLIKTRNLPQALEVINGIAPEHVEIMVKRPERVIKQIRNAGAIFVGPFTPTAVGDYVAGPSHVLPTNGTARFFSGLGVADFMKRTHVIGYTRKALEKVRVPAEFLANLEGLKKHAESIRVRFEPVSV